MGKYLNVFLEYPYVTLFYRVHEYVRFFDEEELGHKVFLHTVDFKGPDLLKCKRDADSYWAARKGIAEDNQYFMSIAGNDALLTGFNAEIAVYIAFVEYYSEHNYREHILDADNEYTARESSEVEMAVLRRLQVK